jgi:hypothetical protein
MDDLTSILLAFGGLFALLGLWLARQEARARRLERRLFELETANPKAPGGKTRP